MLFCSFLCLLRLVLPSPFSTADVFQFLDTVLYEILNVTSDHSCRCIKNRVYNTFSLRYFVSSIRAGLYKSHVQTYTRISYKFFCTNRFLKLLKHKLEFLINSSVQIPLIKLEFLRNTSTFSEAATGGVPYKELFLKIL